jgi:hypothetical protein
MRLNDTNGDFAGVALATIKVDYFRHFYSYFIIGPKDALGLILADSSTLYVRPLPDSAINKICLTVLFLLSHLKRLKVEVPPGFHYSTAWSGFLDMLAWNGIH